jgi:hypothetical protein
VGEDAAIIAKRMTSAAVVAADVALALMVFFFHCGRQHISSRQIIFK